MQFRLTVYRSETAEFQTLSLDSGSAEDARRLAESQGFTVLSVRGGSRVGALFARREKFSALLFCQQLLALLEAGLGLVETIDLLCRKSRAGMTRALLEELYQRLGEGMTFSRAMEAAPSGFPPLLVATVRASEHTGNLVEALRRYIEYEKRVNLLRDKVIAASVYPLVLMVIGGLVVLFLLAYVVPRFSKVYEDMGQGNLPLLSRLLMEWGQLVSDHALVLLLLCAACLGALIWGLMQPAVRAAVEQRVWKLGVIGEHLRVYQLARFTRTLSMLLKGGVPLVSALSLANNLLRQPTLQTGLAQARLAISEGKPVSASFAEHGLSTDVGTRLLVVGERSGDLGNSMERIAAFYDDEIARAVEWFSRLFEPVLMLLIGCVIGAIVILMYLPIFELASTVQ